MPEKDKQLNALLELERRSMAGDPEITPEVKEKIDTKLKAYRDQGLAKPLGGDQNLSETARSRLETDIGIYAGLKGSLGGFQKDYAGNTITGGLENLAQSVNSDLGTPGQRDWWASFKRMDNQVRNELFGATLTPSEQAAYEATTVSPRMDPKEVRQNLRTRAEIVRKALSRRTDYFKTSGYNPKAIDALAGEYAPDFASGFTLPEIVDEEAVPTRASNTALVNADQAPDEIVAQLPPEKEAEIIKLAPYLTPETMVKWFKDNGYDIPPEQAQKAYEYYQSGGKEAAGIDYEAAQEKAKEEARQRLEQEGAGQVRAGIEGVGDTLTLGFQDELRAAGRTLFDDGTYKQNLGDVRAEQDVLAEEYPITSLSGQFAGGAMFPLGLGARTPGALAKVGGLTGAGYGIGSGDTLEERITGGATGGIAGTALGYGGGKILQKLGSRTPPSGPAGPGRETMAAAERIGVDLLPADVGGPFTRGMTGAARQGIVSELPIARQVEKTLVQAQGVRDVAAQGAGDAYQAGRAAQRGAEAAIETTKTRAGKLYDAIPIGADQSAVLNNTRQTLTDLNNKITSNPELAAMLRNKTFEGYQKALSGKGLSWNDLKAFRTEIGHKLDGLILKEDTTKADLDRLYASLSADMEATARAQGPDAIAKFERANRYYRARQDRIRTALLPILGKDAEKGAQAAYNQIQSWAKQKGESARVAQLFRSLPQDEADTVSATVISELGTPPAGQGGTFSLAKFATDWNKLDGRAKAALFRPEVRSALNDLATVAEGAKATAKYSNTSNTGRAVAGQAIIAAVAGGALDFGTLMAGSAAQYLTGAMLASPRVARWMAKGYGLKGPSLKAHIAKLPKLAAGNPAIASDVAALERSLLEATNDNFSRSAAASDQEEK